MAQGRNFKLQSAQLGTYVFHSEGRKFGASCRDVPRSGFVAAVQTGGRYEGTGSMLNQGLPGERRLSGVHIRNEG